MNMKELYDDFCKYVEQMDTATVMESINDAIKHTEDSVVLDDTISNYEMNSKSSTQFISFERRKTCADACRY